MNYVLPLAIAAFVSILFTLWALRRDNLKHAANYKSYGDAMVAADEKIAVLTATVANLRKYIQTSAELKNAMLPKEAQFKVTAQGVAFGKAWFSHEKITGYSAEQLNSGKCGIIGRAYMDWMRATRTETVEVPQ